MIERNPPEKIFGLIGNPLNNHFSENYFNSHFQLLNLPYTYKNFPIQEIGELNKLVDLYPNLMGLSVTKPYKQSVPSFLDELSETSIATQAVNCVEFRKNGKRVGHNTDVIGFENSLVPFIGSNRNLKALVFGNGGAAKAIVYVLQKLGIQYLQVSRNSGNNNLIPYSALTEKIIDDHKLLINTTSVGMFPETETELPIPYRVIGAEHFCYDVIYLPEKTMFLTHSENQGAKIKNGLEMLHLQADEAWKIWQCNLT